MTKSRRRPAAAAADPADVATRIGSLLPSLVPAERQVARVLLDRAADAAELSSQQIADLAATSRATVVRTAQSLGYRGYQQLRVLLARDALLRRRATGGDTADRNVPGVAAATFAAFRQVHDTSDQMTSLLDASAIGEAVDRLAGARRILVVGHGLSRSLAIDAATRLVRLGLVAENRADRTDQSVVIRQLGADDVVLIISDSGSHRDSLALAREAGEAAPRLIVITAHGRSPIARSADVLLVVGMPESTHHEPTDSTRIPQAILIEGLMASLREQLGERGRQAAALVRSATNDHVSR
jgi:RpiR family transcriptional regulator, carbohydrate utilization regulator